MNTDHFRFRKPITKPVRKLFGRYLPRVCPGLNPCSVLVSIFQNSTEENSYYPDKIPKEIFPSGKTLLGFGLATSEVEGE